MNSGVLVEHPSFGPALPELNWVPAPRYLLRRERVLRHLRDFRPGRVLDIGCGPGALIYELSKRGFETFGVDSSPKALELSRHLQERSLRMEVKGEVDPRSRGSFDLLLSLEVIEHITDDVGALREWRRYLMTGGRLILSTPAHQRRWNSADEWAGHIRRYERSQIIQIVEAAGFEVETVESYGFPLANILDLISAPVYRRKLQLKSDRSREVDALTAESGSDRSAHARLWPVFSSRLGVLIMRVFYVLQSAFAKSSLGPGLIVIAKAV